MRPNNNPLNFGTVLAPDYSPAMTGNLTSVAQWADCIVRASFQVVVTGNAVGTIQAQGANQQAFGLPANQFQPLNWSNVGGSAVAVSGPGSFLFPQFDSSYEYLRLKWVNTGTGQQTIATLGDESGVAQVEDVTCVDDVSTPGTLAISAITFPALAGATGGDYVVFYKWNGQAFAAALNVSGTDPEPTGAIWQSVGINQRINVDISGAVTASDVANLVSTAIQTLPQMDMTIGAVVAGAFTVTQVRAAPISSSIVHNADDSGAGSIVAPAPSPQGANPISSLNSTYFLLYDANDGATYYVWYDVDGYGIDPAIGGGAIGIHVAISGNDTAATIATTSTGPISSISGGVPFNANAFMNDLLIYNQQDGPSTIPTDGSAATGFSFVISVPGFNQGTVLLNNTYFLCSDANDVDKYAVWFDVGGGGVAPVVPGYTSVSVAINPHDDANTVATTLAGVLSGLTDFASGVISANLVALDNNGAGPFTPAFDGAVPTGFTFSVTAGTGTMSARMKSMGL